MSIIEQALEKRRSRGDSSRVNAAQPQARARASERMEPRWQPPTPESDAGSQNPESGSAPRVELDFNGLRRQGIPVPGDKRSTLAEEFRLMKRPLLQNAFGRPPMPPVPRGRMIMITSALPGEGKTFTSVNLALSMAMEVNKTVLLIDADVARPAVPRTLGIRESERGLMDALIDPHTRLEELIQRTNIPNLSLLPAGPAHRRSTEMLASERMLEILDEVHTRYSNRILLFDSPPLLATSEPGVLAMEMGQVVLVVEAERTPRSSVERAMEQLQSCDVVLTTLNKTAPILGLGYGYGYGYYSSRGDGEPEHER